MNDISYQNWDSYSDKALLEKIGAFIQHHRLEQNKTQDQVAQAAGISRSTLSLLERGEKVRIDSLIQVLRVLGLLYVMDVFKVQKQISPIEYAKLSKKQRLKASASKNSSPDKVIETW